MRTQNKQELIDNVKKLNEEEKYQEVIDMLYDEVLEKYNDYELYAEISQAKCRLKCNDYNNYAQKSLLISENSKAYHYLGNYNLDVDNIKAKYFYEKAIELNEDSTYSYAGLGTIYYHENNLEKSIEYFQIALKKLPKDSYINTGIGNVYFERNEYYKAIDCYLISMDVDPKDSAAYYNLANIYFNKANYLAAKEYFQKYLELEKNDKKNFYYENAESKIREINKIQFSDDYKNIQKIISKIQKCLEYEEDCITHFTGLSIAKELILKRSEFRLSEGTFLNDTSEGTTLFDYLEYESPFNKKESHIDEIFVQKPFIGSFVAQSKHNDLTMWRMYGKEGMEEARGCAITMNKEIFVEEILKTYKIDKSTSSDKNFKFYRVAYKNEKNKFFIPELSTRDPKIKELNDLCDKLKKILEDFNKKPESKEVQKDIEELLFEVAFLFKGVEYQYEHEVRLVQKGIGFEKFIDQDFKIPRVYIKLADISKSISKITLGPKVERADEWASALYYTLQNNDVDMEIHISKQPFK